MQTVRLALIGFGNVGRGMASIIRDKNDYFTNRFGVRFAITAISDLLKGSIYDPNGFDPAVLLEAVESDGNLNN
ncbi:MAG: hypothetical protein JXA42_07130, partial [Anaerolineales bacterium]|nr:hypothetical protein [Anaerolineales bacterium]